MSETISKSAVVTDEMVEAALKAYHDTKNGYQWWQAESNLRDTIRAALEAAAQADCEARIRSALVAAPALRMAEEALAIAQAALSDGGVEGMLVSPALRKIDAALTAIRTESQSHD